MCGIANPARSVTTACLLFAGLWQSGGNCPADVFHFKDGRVIAGATKGPTQKTVDGQSVTVWVVEVEPGTYLQFYDSDLKRNGHETPNDAELEYAQRVAALAEAAEDHYALAGWCTLKGLKDLAQAHYLRVLDIDPNHEPARAATDYRKDDNGRWVKNIKIMGEQRGKILHKGRWQFPESVALEQAEAERDAKVIAASKDIPRWHNDAVTGSGKRQAQALENLQQVNDPLSVGILADLLQGKRKPPSPPQMKLLYVRLLSQFQTFDAAQALAQASITAPEPEVRNAALDSLQNFGRAVAVPVFIGYLKNVDNELVNRAAYGLGQLHADEAVLPLIEALVTEHPQSVGGGNTNYSTGGISFGGKQQIVEVPLQNPSVRGTLSQLTNRNYDYDQTQWLAWYASVYAAPVDDLRRDP